MCGIAGFINPSCTSDAWEGILAKTAETLRHRGPDGEGIWYDAQAGIGLAHRRLSIIDLSENGRQPMFSASGRYVVVYNGEIYNFPQLRREIEQETQPAWRSTSDTEVMLAAIDLWGVEKAVPKFIGMFAFALWDRRDSALYLVRDRLGIKPLFYSRFGRTFLFGSELKALRKHPDFKPAIDRNALALYLRHNCIPAPYSIYENTFKLEPGTILRICADGIRRRHELPSPVAFWSAKEVVENACSSFESQADEAEQIDTIERLLKEAVAMRMVSDVSLGVFLSGGVDSSTVAALMQLQSPVPVRTFSIGFEEQGYDESPHARAIARHLGTQHTELYVSPTEAQDSIPEMPQLYDEPFGDSSQIPTYLLSRLTRKHVTVCLSGDGGDEIFGGYNRYVWVQKIRRVQQWLPRFVRETTAGAACKISPANWDRLAGRAGKILPRNLRYGAIGDKIHKLASTFRYDSTADIYYSLISHWPHPEAVVRNASEPLTKVTHPENHPQLNNDVQLMMYLDLVTYLPDDILTKVDRASMGVGLEARVPLLDHRIVEAAWRLPLHLKIRDGQGKWILRQILYKHVPRKLIERPKSGFAIPLDSWLRGRLRDWAESLLNPQMMHQEGYLNPSPIQKKWKAHLSGNRNWQYQLWDILMFQAWLQTVK